MNQDIRRKISTWRDKAGISPQEFMAITGVSRSMTYKMLKEGQLPAIRVGERRLIIPTQAVEEMLAQAWTNVKAGNQ